MGSDEAKGNVSPNVPDEVSLPRAVGHYYEWQLRLLPSRLPWGPCGAHRHVPCVNGPDAAGFFKVTQLILAYIVYAKLCALIPVHPTQICG